MPVITKADGTKQQYQRKKIIKTCRRLHASKETAELVANQIEKQLYDGIPSKKILQLIFKYLTDPPGVKHQIDLRMAVSLLRSQPDFEQFIQMLLEEYGYAISGNQILRGKCVEHEIDAIAQKDDEMYLVEIKHHSNSHTYSGLDIPRITQATFEDLVDGFNLGLNSVHFTKALIVCNTKFSAHATQYAKCKGIDKIGWKAPPKQGLERMIEAKKFYPVTLLKGLNKKRREKFLDNGIILLNQLITADARELGKKTKIRKDLLERMIIQAQEILSNS